MSLHERMQLDTMRYSCGERYYKDGREIEAPEEYIQIVKMKINTDHPAVKLKKILVMQKFVGRDPVVIVKCYGRNKLTKEEEEACQLSCVQREMGVNVKYEWSISPDSRK